SGRRAPPMIAVLGAGGVGKTVYLGMLLDMMARGVGGLRATVEGAHSISLQQRATTSLAAGCFPDPTPAGAEHWDWVHCRVECRRRRRRLSVILADPAGGAWAEEADHPGAHPALASLLKRAAGVVVLADAQRLHAGDHGDDFVTLKLLSQLGAARPRGRFVRRREPRPLALVFSKADACQACLDQPEDFAQSHAAALLGGCTARLPNTRVFAASAVGASAIRSLNGHNRHVALRVEPQGVVEPLGWLLTQLP
ncbi:MAG: hypothetical protein AAF790_08550, partial [Planctomycetota bacterium]